MILPRPALLSASFLLQLLWVRCSVSKVVQHEFSMTWESGAPNGQSRDMILTNGQFPGPALMLDEQDEVEVTVHNRMPFNTTVHWHGLEMKDTPWSDGVPGLTQMPIEPGESYVYRFTASPAGTYWYHSHSRATMLDGLYGAIHIRPRQHSPTPWHLISNDVKDIEAMQRAALDPKLLLISDWTKVPSWEYMAAQKASGYSIFCVDSILINGKGSVFCPPEEYLVEKTSYYMQWALAPKHVNDKGCFPFVFATEGPYLESGDASKIPRHMQEGCVPSQGESELIEVNADEEKWVSLNFVGAATFKTIIFSIDDHPMWVYEVDGHFIEPQLVQTVNMYAGERYSVMVKLDQKPRDYAIRVSDNCLTQVISAYATLSYDGGRKSRKQVDMTQTRGYIDYAGQHTSTDVVTLDSDHVVPFPAKVPAKTADAEYHFFTHRWNNPYEYTMTGWGLYEEDQNAYKPLLYNVNSREAHDGRTVIRTQNGTWVDLVLNVGSFADQPQEFPHMMHKHASKTWRIGAGMGIWNYTSVAEAMETEPHSFNLVEPPFRDTWVTSFDGPSWMVLRYQVTNPGAFLLHCHVESHLAGGMAVVIMDGVDAWPEIPSEYALGQNGFPLIEEMDDAVVAAQNEKLSEMASTSPLRAGNPSDSALSGLAWFELVLSGGIQFLRGLLKDA